MVGGILLDAGFRAPRAGPDRRLRTQCTATGSSEPPGVRAGVAITSHRAGGFGSSPVAPTRRPSSRPASAAASRGAAAAGGQQDEYVARSAVGPYLAGEPVPVVVADRGDPGGLGTRRDRDNGCRSSWSLPTARQRGAGPAAAAVAGASRRPPRLSVTPARRRTGRVARLLPERREAYAERGQVGVDGRQRPVMGPRHGRHGAGAGLPDRRAPVRTVDSRWAALSRYARGAVDSAAP
jgi:hypothetical protein